MTASVSLALLSVASVALAWIDLRRGLIPNWLNLGIALTGLARVAALDGSAAPVAASVCRDGKEPRGDLRPAVVLVRFGNHFHEHLLRDLFGQGSVGEEPVGETEESGRISFEKLRRPVRVATADPLEERPVVGPPLSRAIHRPLGTAFGETVARRKGFVVLVGSGCICPGLFHRMIYEKSAGSVSRQLTPPENEEAR